MFLIPILLPAKQSLLKIITPEIIVSVPERLHDDDISFFESNKDKLRTSHTSFKSFADDFEVDRSRLLLDRTPNLSSRPNSFILFSIVPEGSFRDLSLSNERHSNSREASHTSLARLSEIRVESRVNSYTRLEPLAEAETSDSGSSSECLDAIQEPQTPVPELLVTPSLSCDCINESTSHVKTVDTKAESVPNIIVSESTESGFASEESVASTCDTKELISSTSDLDETRLSGYSWNSTGSDLSWKTQCSEAGTEDSGYGEDATPCLTTEDMNGHSKASINTYISQDNLKSDLKQDNGYCSCDSALDVEKDNTELSSNENKGVTLCAQKGPLIEDPGPSSCWIEEKETQLMRQSYCACGEDEDDSVHKLISDAKEIIELKEPFIPESPQPPDIYSQLFEGILEEVNDYVENYSELSDCQDLLTTWPKVSMTDLKSCEQETVV